MVYKHETATNRNQYKFLEIVRGFKRNNIAENMLTSRLSTFPNSEINCGCAVQYYCLPIHGKSKSLLQKLYEIFVVVLKLVGMHQFHSSLRIITLKLNNLSYSCTAHTNNDARAAFSLIKITVLHSLDFFTHTFSNV